MNKDHIVCLGDHISGPGEILLDVDKLISTRMLIQANSGGGKSHTLRKIAEEAHGKVQQIIIDIEGEFVTLREKYEYLLVGKNGDVPASVKTAAMLAHRLLKLGVSAIIDLSEMTQHDRIIFVKLFLEAMIDSPKELWHSCLVFVDETHIFCPEHGKAESASAVIELATRGRKRGFCAIYSTQRISKLHKDAAAECNNKLIGRTGLDIDRKRASEELGFTTKEQNLSLRDLQRGEFYSFGPALSQQIIKGIIGKVQTTQPKPGDMAKLVTTAPQDAMKHIINELADLETESEKELKTVNDLKREVQTLRSELTKSKRQLPSAPPKVVEKIITKTVTVAEPLNKKYKNQIALHKQRFMQINQLIAEIPWPPEESPIVVPKPTFSEAVTNVRASAAYLKETVRDAVMPKAIPEYKLDMSGIPNAHYNEATDSVFVPSSSQYRILASLSKLHYLGRIDVDRDMVAGLSEVSCASSSYANNLSTLKTNGLVEYSSPGKLRITKKGLSLLPEFNILTEEELQHNFKNVMSSSQVRIFNALLSSHPTIVSRDHLANAAGVSVTSSSFANNLSTLRKLGVIEYDPMGIKLTQNVFLEEQ